MYRKLGEAKLRPGIERLSQIKALRQLSIAGETHGVVLERPFGRGTHLGSLAFDRADDSSKCSGVSDQRTRVLGGDPETAPVPPLDEQLVPVGIRVKAVAASQGPYWRIDAL
jgi:hypothetical protein